MHLANADYDTLNFSSIQTSIKTFFFLSAVSSFILIVSLSLNSFVRAVKESFGQGW